MAYNISLCCIFEFNTKILFYKTCLQFFFSVSKTYSLKEKATFLMEKCVNHSSSLHVCKNPWEKKNGWHFWTYLVYLKLIRWSRILSDGLFCYNGSKNSCHECCSDCPYFDACFQQYSFCQKFNMKINSVFSIDL